MYLSLHIMEPVMTLSQLWGILHCPCRFLCLGHLLDIQPLHTESERKRDACRRKREVHGQLYRSSIGILEGSQYFGCSCEALESCRTHCQNFGWTNGCGSLRDLFEEAIYKHTLTDGDGDGSKCIERRGLKTSEGDIEVLTRLVGKRIHKQL